MPPELLKIRHASGRSGGDLEFWQEHWEGRDLSHAVRRLAADPVATALEARVSPGMRLLEGGCGQGEYVLRESTRGVWTVGLDFALDPLLELRANAPDVPLVVGDVHALPFREGSFAAYYSGGVVEHFEGGPEPALAEARRMLVPGGLLLVSVPYLSPLRRVLRWTRRAAWTTVERTTSEPPRDPGPFFQYAFAPRRFRTVLAQADVEVVDDFGYGVVRGLIETASPLERAVRARSQERRAPRDTDADVTAIADGPPSLLRRLVVAEDVTVPVLGGVVRALRWGCANMQMYVGRAR